MIFLLHSLHLFNGLYTPFGSSMVFTPPSVPPLSGDGNAIGGQKRQSGESNISLFTFHYSLFTLTASQSVRCQQLKKYGLPSQDGWYVNNMRANCLVYPHSSLCMSLRDA